MGKNNITTIWDWLKEINNKKSHPNSFTQGDFEFWNSYSIHRFISMDPSYVEIVNYVQGVFQPTQKKEIYTVYREFIPKNNTWNKYIKSTKKQRNKDLVEHLSKYWGCSTTEVREYLEFLGNDEVEKILLSLGVENKEIKKIIK